MSASIALRPAHARPRLTLRGVLDHIAAAEARYRTRLDLQRLDDRLLRDMGASRADVDAELRRGCIW